MSIRFATSQRRDMRPLSSHGIFVSDCYRQLQALLEKHGAELARMGMPGAGHFLAEPMTDATTGTIDWYAGGTKAPVPLSALDPAEQALATRQLAACDTALSALLASLSGDPAMARQADFLKMALKHPGSSDMYWQDGHIVLTNWGFAPGTPDSVPQDIVRGVAFARVQTPQGSRQTAAAGMPVEPRGQRLDSMTCATTVTRTGAARSVTSFSLLWWLLPILFAGILIYLLLVHAGVLPSPLPDTLAEPSVDMSSEERRSRSLNEQAGLLLSRIEERAALCRRAETYGPGSEAGAVDGGVPRRGDANKVPFMPGVLSPVEQPDVRTEPRPGPAYDTAPDMETEAVPGDPRSEEALHNAGPFDASAPEPDPKSLQPEEAAGGNEPSVPFFGMEPETLPAGDGQSAAGGNTPADNASGAKGEKPLAPDFGAPAEGPGGPDVPGTPDQPGTSFPDFGQPVIPDTAPTGKGQDAGDGGASGTGGGNGGTSGNGGKSGSTRPGNIDGDFLAGCWRSQDPLYRSSSNSDQIVVEYCFNKDGTGTRAHYANNYQAQNKICSGAAKAKFRGPVVDIDAASMACPNGLKYSSQDAECYRVGDRIQCRGRDQIDGSRTNIWDAHFTRARSR